MHRFFPDRPASHAFAATITGVAVYSTGPVLVAASTLPGPTFTAWRMMLAVPLLAASCLLTVRGAWWRGLGRQRWWLVAGGVMFAATQLLYFTALGYASVADVSLIATLAPVFVALGAARWLDERPGRRFRWWTAVAIAGAGVIVVTAGTAPRGNVTGVALAFGNTVCFAAFDLISKRVRRTVGAGPYLLATTCLAAAAVTGGVAVASGRLPAPPVGRDLALVAAVVAGPGFVGIVLMTWALRWLPVNTASVLRLSQPALSAVLAWAAIGQPITLAHTLGGLLTLLGVGGVLTTPGAHSAHPGHSADSTLTVTRVDHGPAKKGGQGTGGRRGA